jgi:tRNA 2-selenouridine synthase
MPNALSVVPFLKLPESLPILDVRSPGEFDQGHIPGAISFPLFSNPERAEVGTIYKQIGKDEALIRGLEFTGPKMAGFVTTAMALAPDKKIRIHCWRGGMRSGSMAWLLEAAGFEVFLLRGGYKAFRREALDHSPIPNQMRIIGGYTGSRKTEILNSLAKLEQPVLDLEALAHHKGSAFGALGQLPQPTQEQFENEIYFKLLQHPFDQILWLEDESKPIGKLRVPDLLHEKMRESQLLFVEKTREERLSHIVSSYGAESIESLEFSMRKIAKRLGGQALTNALECLQNGDVREAASISLFYYDKTYKHGLDSRDESLVQSVDCQGNSDEEAAQKLLMNSGKD